MKKLLLSLFIHLTNLFIVQACTEFLNNDKTSLVIPEGQTCLLNDSSISDIVLKTIAIQGTLSIEDNISLNIKYESLSVGEKGSLEIGKSSPIANCLVVFEQVGDTECQVPDLNSFGKIFASSRQYDLISLDGINKSSVRIRATQKPTNILSKQEYFLFDKLSTDQPEKIFLTDIQEWSLYLKDQIKKDYYTYSNNSNVKPLLMGDIPTISGIIFKNSCLFGTIDKFFGISILNPRGISLKGTSMQSCLIKLDMSSGTQIQRFIQSEGGFQRNICYQCSNLSITSSTQREGFNENTIINSDNLVIKMLSYEINSNQIINSKIIIDYQDKQIFSLRKSSLFNSSLKVKNKEDLSFQVVESFFYSVKSFEVSNNARSIRIQQSNLFSSTFNFANSVISDFSLRENFIDGNNEIDHLAIMKSAPGKQKISVENSSIFDYKSFFFTTADKMKNPQETYFARLTSQILFDISFNQFRYNFKLKEEITLLNLPFMSLSTSIVDGYYSTMYQVVEVDDQNINNSYLMLSLYKWAPVLTYSTDSIPGYYKITDYTPLIDQLINDLTIRISINNGVNKLQPNSGFYNQILGKQVQLVYFEDKNGKNQDLSQITFELVQKQQSERSNKKFIALSSNQRAIKSVRLIKDGTPMTDSIKNSLSDATYASDLVVIWNKSTNQLYALWDKLKNEVSVYNIQIDYCAENELFEGTKCITSCATQQSGFYCAKDCAEGFYKDVNSLCQKCPFGCKKCTDGQTCNQCFDIYFKDNNKCIDVCGWQTKAGTNQCEKFPDACAMSQNSYGDCDICLDYFSYYKNGKCTKCEDNQDNYCKSCPKNCKTCIDDRTYPCLECAEGYERQFGQCLEKKSSPMLFEQDCENGQSFIDGKCQSCQKGCLTCTSTGGYGSCQTCITSYKREYFGSSCESCKAGQYGDASECYSCHSLCDKSQSQSCVGPSSFQCQKCISGYFQEPKNNQCKACDLSKCKECAISSTQCTDCPEKKYLYDSKCLDSCPSGFYPDKNRVCHQCDLLLCKECANSPSQCTECKVGQVLFEEKCYKGCESGYFADKNSVCKLCDLNKCEECIQYETKCTKCKSNLYLINHSCEEQCPEKGYFFDTQNNCKQCHEDCEKCADSPTKCTDCEYPMYLENNQCLQECPEGKYGAYIKSISKCVECDSSKCKACVDHSQKCTLCDDNLYLYKNKCYQDCPQGTNKNEATKSCLLCLQPNCDVCGDNIGLCLICNKGFLQHQGVCVKECPEGYFLNKSEQRCEECDKRVCMECYGTPTSCTRCYPEHFNIGYGTCSTSCPKLAFPFQEGKQQVCKPCDPLCTKGCVGPLESECLEAVYITQEAKNEAIMICLLVVSFILLLSLLGVIYLYYKKRQTPQKQYLLSRAASQSDVGTVIQMEERIENLKQMENKL